MMGLVVQIGIAVFSLLLGGRFIVRRAHSSHIYLGIFFLLFAIHMTLYGQLGSGLLIRYPQVLLFFDAIPFCYGPLLFLYYSRFISVPQDQSTRPLVWAHFIPLVIQIITYWLIYFIQGDAYVRQITTVALSEGKAPAFVLLFDFAKLVSGAVYLCFIIMRLKKQWPLLKRYTSYDIHGGWIRNLIILTAVVWTLIYFSQILVLLLDSSVYNYEMRNFIVSIIYLFFIAANWIFVLQFPHIFNPLYTRSKIKQNLNLSDDAIKHIFERLDVKMKEGMYLLPDLKLEHAASEIDSHSNIISFALNEYMGMSFREYVNSFRIQHFLKKAKTELAGQTMLSLALESGFNSKATFNRVFKKQMHCSPREYFS